MGTPKQLKDPPLRKIWKEAKKKAEKLAAKKKEDKTAYSALNKQFKMDLGPSLDKFHKFYPKLDKMKAHKEKKIDKPIKEYQKLIKSSNISTLSSSEKSNMLS